MCSEVVPVTSAPFTRIDPEVGVTSPVMMLNRVDLPHPLGPTMETNSPRSACRVSPRSTRVTPWDVPYSLSIPTTSRLRVIAADPAIGSGGQTDR